MRGLVGFGVVLAFARVDMMCRLSVAVLYYIVLDCIALYCIVLHCIALYYIVLRCIVSHRIVSYVRTVLHCMYLLCELSTWSS